LNILLMLFFLFVHKLIFPDKNFLLIKTTFQPRTSLLPVAAKMMCPLHPPFNELPTGQISVRAIITNNLHAIKTHQFPSDIIITGPESDKGVEQGQVGISRSELNHY